MDETHWHADTKLLSALVYTYTEGIVQLSYSSISLALSLDYRHTTQQLVWLFWFLINHVIDCEA